MISYDELNGRIAKALALSQTLDACESVLDSLLHTHGSADSAQKVRTSIVPDIWDENDLAMTVGERIRFERKKRGWPQKELSKATGIARPNIARLESGRQIPSLPTLQRVARSFGVPLSELLRPVG